MKKNNEANFFLHIDRRLGPEELEKRLYRPQQSMPKISLKKKPKWQLRPIAWRSLIKKVLNRFPILWRPARWLYNHLYLSRKLYQINERQDRLEVGLQQQAQRLEQLNVEYQAIHEQQAKKLDELKAVYMSEITQLKTLLNRLERKQDEQALILKTTQIKPQASAENVSLSLAETSRLDRFYLHFENRFRGSESDIAAYQAHYEKFIPSIAKKKPVLDIGCGRGEWLSFLQEKGFLVEGVDLTQSMVDYCQQKGLPVHCEDAFNMLSRVKPGSYAAITAFHVVEHLPFPRILELMESAWGALDEQGVLILETPNPENLQVGAHTFWMDPTHLKPLPPALLAFAAEYVGFARTHIERLHPYSVEASSDPLVRQLQTHLYREQDYALIAWKHVG